MSDLMFTAVAIVGLVAPAAMVLHDVFLHRPPTPAPVPVPRLETGVTGAGVPYVLGPLPTGYTSYTAGQLRDIARNQGVPIKV